MVRRGVTWEWLGSGLGVGGGGREGGEVDETCYECTYPAFCTTAFNHHILGTIISSIGARGSRVQYGKARRCVRRACNIRIPKVVQYLNGLSRTDMGRRSPATTLARMSRFRRGSRRGLHPGVWHHDFDGYDNAGNHPACIFTCTAASELCRSFPPSCLFRLGGDAIVDVCGIYAPGMYLKGQHNDVRDG